MNLSVQIAGVTLKNPVTTASGTFGSGMEYGDFFDLSTLGAVTTKGVAAEAWEGNPVPRIAETRCGMLNAVGLQNPGVALFCQRDLPYLKERGASVIVNVCGHSQEEYLAVVERLSDEPVDLLEINVSCPNIKQGGIAFGQDPGALFEITRAVKKIARQPIIMKLSPNVTDISEMARAAQAGGSDALSLINTITGMKIDIHRRCFALANKTGGLSGPAIKPVAVRMIYQVYEATHLPIIGMGGVVNGEDAIELMMAGASMVAVGTATFHDPFAAVKVLEGIKSYMSQYQLKDIREIVGCIHQ